MSRHALARGGFLFTCERLPPFEIALVLLGLDHIASVIVNVNHGINVIGWLCSA